MDLKNEKFYSQGEDQIISTDTGRSSFRAFYLPTINTSEHGSTLNTKAYCVHLHSSTKYSTLQEVQLHSIMMTAFHINECIGWQKEQRGHLVFVTDVFLVIGVWNYKTPASHCAVMIVSYLSLNGKPLQTIPMNLLVRIGLRLTLSFVWSGDMLEAQQDFSVKLRITIQWGFCFTVCASLPSHKSPEISES